MPVGANGHYLVSAGHENQLAASHVITKVCMLWWASCTAWQTWILQPNAE